MFCKDRLQLGNAIKNCVFLAIALALRYLCKSKIVIGGFNK